jgi:hypothetical protein
VHTLKLAVAWFEGVVGGGLVLLAATALPLEGLSFSVAACACGVLLVGAGWTLTRHGAAVAPLQASVVIMLLVWVLA